MKKKYWYIGVGSTILLAVMLFVFLQPEKKTLAEYTGMHGVKGVFLYESGRYRYDGFLGDSRLLEEGTAFEEYKSFFETCRVKKVDFKPEKTPAYLGSLSHGAVVKFQTEEQEPFIEDGKEVSCPYKPTVTMTLAASDGAPYDASVTLTYKDAESRKRFGETGMGETFYIKLPSNDFLRTEKINKIVNEGG